MLQKDRTAYRQVTRMRRLKRKRHMSMWCVRAAQGVLGMAWCPYDPTLLLSCGKDSRNICWDVHSTDIVCELPSSHSWNFDIQWAPHSRGVFATSCFDGEVGLHNLLNCTISKIEQTVNADFSVSHTVSGTWVHLAWRTCCLTAGAYERKP